MEKCPLLQVSCTCKCDVDEMPRNEVPETGSIFVKYIITIITQFRVVVLVMVSPRTKFYKVLYSNFFSAV